jgi:hypothetical protein
VPQVRRRDIRITARRHDETPKIARWHLVQTAVGAAALMPLSLEAGRHGVELRAACDQTWSFDVDVVSGQVTPYRRSMQPVRE